MISASSQVVELGFESLCAPFVTELKVTGATISVSAHHGRQSSVCASGGLAAQLDTLQFELGEGPRREVLASRSAVLCPDVAEVKDSSFPVFLEAAKGLGVESMFAFPMLMGAALVGVVDLYCTRARPADSEFVARAMLMTGRVAGAAVQRALHSAENHRSDESPMAPALRREVHQATGMIISQLGITATEAFSRLQGHAFASEKRIEDIAHDVVSRTLTFDDLPE